MILHSLLNLSSFKPDLQLEAHSIFAIDGKNERHQLPFTIHELTQANAIRYLLEDCRVFAIFRNDSICMLTSVVCGIK